MFNLFTLIDLIREGNNCFRRLSMNDARTGLTVEAMNAGLNDPWAWLEFPGRFQDRESLSADSGPYCEKMLANSP